MSISFSFFQIFLLIKKVIQGFSSCFLCLESNPQNFGQERNVPILCLKPKQQFTIQIGLTGCCTICPFVVCFALSS
jgi:hypothetical protein